MRAQNAYDREGNSYRFQRSMSSLKALEERKAQEAKWCEIYQKTQDKSEKEAYSDANNK